jgi:arylsulfatase A-like enzyme
MVGELFAFLEEENLFQKTIIVITSDHGEAFLEHGHIQHTSTVYEELIRVPLILYVPSMKGGVRIDCAVSHVDILPTLFNLMDIQYSKTLQGQSLIPLMEEGGGMDRLIYSETHLPNRTLRSCIIKDDWKFIQGNTDASLLFPAPAPYELYHLTEDAMESNDLKATHAETAEQFKSVLQKMRTNFRQANELLNKEGKVPQVISEELKEVLRQQGYL